MAFLIIFFIFIFIFILLLILIFFCIFHILHLHITFFFFLFRFFFLFFFRHISFRRNIFFLTHRIFFLPGRILHTAFFCCGFTGVFLLFFLLFLFFFLNSLGISVFFICSYRFNIFRILLILLRVGVFLFVHIHIAKNFISSLLSYLFKYISIAKINKLLNQSQILSEFIALFRKNLANIKLINKV